MKELHFDLIVIGAGPGGYVAAIRGAQLGMKVALVEKADLGGVCLNWGCIPTKALLKSSEIYHKLQHLNDFGLKASQIGFDFEKIIRRSREVSKKLSSGIAHLLKKNKIELVKGEAILQGHQRVSIGNVGLLQAPHIILATGARPRVLPNLEPDGKLIWTSKEAMLPPKQPQRLLVIGSGAIGIEFASFYSTFGTKVHVVELQDRILPIEDSEISILAQKSLEKQGIQFSLSSKIISVKKEKDTVHVQIQPLTGQPLSLTFDAVLVAAGIQGNVENLGLEKTKCQIEKNHIVTNEWCETSEPGLYAIGDVAGPPWLAHKASHEATLCVEKIKNVPFVQPLNKQAIPGCTYARPQVASVGLTEAAAKEQFQEIKVGRFPFLANGKSLASGESEGLIKTIFDAKTGELLGAHMIGEGVTELIHSLTLAKTLEATEEDLMHTIFPHPTFSEMIHESVLDAYQKAIHF